MRSLCLFFKRTKLALLVLERVRPRKPQEDDNDKSNQKTNKNSDLIDYYELQSYKDSVEKNKQSLRYLMVFRRVYAYIIGLESR